MLKLNKNQINFCEEYVINDYNGSKAYQIAYNQENKNVAAVGASTLLRDIRVIDKIREIEGDYKIIGYKIGINKKLILSKLKDLLNAKKQVFFNGRNIGETDDHAASNKAIETLLKMMGDFAPEKKQIIMDDETDIKNMTAKERKQYKEK